MLLLTARAGVDKKRTIIKDNLPRPWHVGFSNTENIEMIVIKGLLELIEFARVAYKGGNIPSSNGEGFSD